jgi:hypothetical protein
MHMQGNEEVSREISVVCRIRPLNSKEIRERSDVCTNVRLVQSPVNFAMASMRCTQTCPMLERAYTAHTYVF